MRYAVLGGGKRIRPRLAYAAGRLAGAPLAVVDHAAAAVEFMHGYSLVHDDLPAMDDDDLRRGQPTVHVRFGEATAILAGDALNALAFDVLRRAPADDELVRRWLRILAAASGAAGMVGGQVMDLELEGGNRPATRAEVDATHRAKTGALIRAAAAMGAAAGHLDAAAASALDAFCGEIGLAFQIRDDVLDATASTATLGKRRGADRERGKATYVELLGVEGAADAAGRQLELALGELRPLGDAAHELAQIAHDIVHRVN